MAIKAADILHVGGANFLLSRLQNVGPGGLQIPTEVIKEVGNYKSVAVVRDVPDLSFTANSFDVSTAMELMLTGNTGVPGGGLDMTFCRATDILGLVKPGALSATPFQIVRGIACPTLYPERLAYRFAVQQNSTLDVTLRGDSIFYTPNTPYRQQAAGSGSAGQTITLTWPAGLYTASTGDTRILSLSIDGQRQVEGTDFTVSTPDSDPYSITTVTMIAAVPTTSKISIVYFSSIDHPATYDQIVHPGPEELPAAVKGRDIRVYIGADYDPADPSASAASRWTGVQSANVDWSVNVLKDYELGNHLATTVEPEDVPSVSGSISVRARNSDELFARLRQITGVTDVEKAIGPDNAVELPLDIVLTDSTGTVHKRLHVPDARFSLPGYSAQVGQRVDAEIQWTSDTGSLTVFHL